MRNCHLGEPVTSIGKQRALKGLCPHCGKEAAPYYLCPDCKFRANVGRVLRRGRKGGLFRTIGAGKHQRWFIGDEDAPIKWNAEARKGDRRLNPRLGRKVLDNIENDLIQLINDAGRPVSLEEIYAAWGSLRERRKHGTLANDLKAIIEGKRRIAEKLARRAARWATRLAAE